ncbi:Aste57867_23659 [Aphanomyces stellatus]|uniref:Aste57867_23659 protein n=1 Tax=Aphanomyces stellatus TaxID=120398 RepID=A0A485LNM7_9STRA|nr:hypothetical protein As57867_023587 [Aphanomyces stellatus]VFU00304.1 Aste57867_23659 [Aphanomyces stellatus]
MLPRHSIDAPCLSTGGGFAAKTPFMPPMEFATTLQSGSEHRPQNLSTLDVNGMRALFSYYDTNRDGNLSSDQAIRIFRLLGISVNEAHVHDLEQMSYAEFLSIVDCQVLEATRDATLHEWNTLNHFRTNCVSPHQLAFFLDSCDKHVPKAHLERYLDLYAICDESNPHCGHLELHGFLKGLSDNRPRESPPVVTAPAIATDVNHGRRNAARALQSVDAVSDPLVQPAS